jgi:hypothetical protein
MVLSHRRMPESALETTGRVYVTNQNRSEIVSLEY